MKTDELIIAARDLADEVRRVPFMQPEHVLLAALLIELRGMRAAIENRDMEK